MTEIHPEALEYPPLDNDELDAMAQSISANGQRDPITRDQHDRVVDGRNRLEACQRAGIEPIFETIEFADEDAISDFILDRNVEKRSLSPGQKAMFRACNLARNGNRRNGRWKRDTVIQNLELPHDRAYMIAMNKAGLVLDVAARAAALGDDYALFAGLPSQVKSGELKLDAAYRITQDFEAKAAMAEMAVWLPLAQAANQLEQLSIDATSTELPVIDAPLSKSQRTQLEETAKRFNAAAATIRKYLKEVQ